MAITRDYPYGRSNFEVDLGSATGGFSEVVLPEGRIDSINYRNGNERDVEPRKLPGCVGYGNILLKRGVIGSLDLYEWWVEVRDGGLAKRDVIVRLLSEDRQQIVMSWKFMNAWPVRHGFEPLLAGDCGVAIEYIELAFERLHIE